MTPHEKLVMITPHISRNRWVFWVEKDERKWTKTARLGSNQNMFKTKRQHKVSRLRTHSKKWHPFDFILTRWSSLKEITHTHSYHSANCDTDHFLYAASSINLQPKKFHWTKQPGKRRIDANKMSKPKLMKQLHNELMKRLGNIPSEVSASRRWKKKLRNTIYSTALDKFKSKPLRHVIGLTLKNCNDASYRIQTLRTPPVPVY